MVVEIIFRKGGENYDVSVFQHIGDSCRMPTRRMCSMGTRKRGLFIQGNRHQYTLRASFTATNSSRLNNAAAHVAAFFII